ncbi:MAG: hypothetical protein DMD81_19250 [Candidatus Rokuibacteriota bacterium]|nr:MAG: hypothetical protein DMD81_19250 [Candidatus Rokubacteria bacterium]
MLSSWGITFEGVDVEATPDRLADLKKFGIPRVPATITGERFVHGWNPQQLAELVGVNYDGGRQLSPDELARRLEVILAAAQRVIRQVPREHLQMTGPGRNRSVRDLAYHVFRLSLGFREAREQGHFPAEFFDAKPPAGIESGEDVARYGDTVRERLREFFGKPGWCDGETSTFYGMQTAHALMERTTWHAAQHLRQLYWLLGRMGVTPDKPLTDADLAGLPFPKEVWS